MFDASERENSLNDLIRYVHDLEYGATARNSIHTDWILLVSQQWNKDWNPDVNVALKTN